MSSVWLFSPPGGKIFVTGLLALSEEGGVAEGNVGMSSVLAGEEHKSMEEEAELTDVAETGVIEGSKVWGAISTEWTVAEKSMIVGWVVMGAGTALSSSTFSRSFSLFFSFSRSFSARAASRRGRIRSAIEVFLLFPSDPPSPFIPRTARTFLKAKKSPNFFRIFFEEAIAVVDVVVERDVVPHVDSAGCASLK